MTATSKVQLDIGLLLPEVANEADPCLDRLRSMLEGRGGVERVHITRDGPRARLCIHFDPDRLSVSRVEAFAEAAGAEIESGTTHLDLPVAGAINERRARLLAARVESIDGVLFARTAGGRIHVEFEAGADRHRVEAALEKLGIQLDRDDDPRHARDGDGHEHGASGLEIGFSLTAGALTLVGWWIGAFLPDASEWAPRIVLWAAYFFGGFFALREVGEGLRVQRLQIDFLTLVAAAGAAALGAWTEGAFLLFLFSLGHSLEGYAMGRARHAIEALADLAPRTATVLRSEGREEEVGVEQLVVGDRVLVRPNSRVAADAFVVQGVSTVNQAPITGESMPVDKRPVENPGTALSRIDSISPESKLFAGTINGAAALEAIVIKLAADSTLARVVKMVREAQTQQSPTQRFTDRFERIFVPSVLGLVVISLFAWVVIDEPFAASFYRAMALLVAASPCALAIATPSAVLSGVARAARGGVLIKGGAHLETLGMVRVIAFDKTGTLTRGEPRVTDIEVAEGATRSELMRIAGSVERRSDHPLARAVVDAVEDELADVLPEPEEVSAITGFGVQAIIDGKEVYLGKPALFTERLGRALPERMAAAVARLTESGRTTILVACDGRFLGVMGLMDPPRDSAAATLRALHDMGVERLMMLTGDHQRAADGVAAEVGLDDARGDLLPEDKVAVIRDVVAGGEQIAMVGDGVNDAPAMAQATVGIAMGAGGSDVALETADVALMADDLERLPFAVGLSRASRRIIRQNLWASLGMVAFLIPATLVGFAGIGWAVLLHEGSTLVVVANALRLLAYSDRG